MQGDLLNTTGLFLLGLLEDSRYVAVAAVTVFLALLLITFVKYRKGLDLIEAIRGALAIITLFSVVPIVCVFILTKPPAIAKLSDDSRTVVGVVCSLVLIYLGLGEVDSVFLRRKIASSSVGSTPAQPTTSAVTPNPTAKRP